MNQRAITLVVTTITLGLLGLSLCPALAGADPGRFRIVSSPAGLHLATGFD